MGRGNEERSTSTRLQAPGDRRHSQTIGIGFDHRTDLLAGTSLGLKACVVFRQGIQIDDQTPRHALTSAY